MVVILGYCYYQVTLHKSRAELEKESNVNVFIFNWASIKDAVGFKCKEAGSKVISRHSMLSEETYLKHSISTLS